MTYLGPMGNMAYPMPRNPKFPKLPTPPRVPPVRGDMEKWEKLFEASMEQFDHEMDRFGEEMDSFSDGIEDSFEDTFVNSPQDQLSNLLVKNPYFEELMRNQQLRVKAASLTHPIFTNSQLLIETDRQVNESSRRLREQGDQLMREEAFGIPPEILKLSLAPSPSVQTRNAEVHARVQQAKPKDEPKFFHITGCSLKNGHLGMCNVELPYAHQKKKHR